MGRFDSVVYKIRFGPEMTRDSFDPLLVNTLSHIFSSLLKKTHGLWFHGS